MLKIALSVFPTAVSDYRPRYVVNGIPLASSKCRFSYTLSTKKNSLIRLKSGEYGGKYKSKTLRLSQSCLTPAK